MVFFIASTPPAFDPDVIILWIFAAAAVVFFVSWAIRAAFGKGNPSGETPATPRLSAEDAALEAPSADQPLPRSDSPYAPPGVVAPPLPEEAAATPPSGIFKVSTALYRWVDLPLIALVFLIFAGLTAANGAPEAVPMEKKFTPAVLIASMVFQFLLAGMVVAFVSWRVKIAEWLGLRWRQWPLAFAIAPVTVFLMWCLMGVLMFTGWNKWLEDSLGIESMQEAVKLLQEAKDPLVIALMAVAAVVVAPLAEEVVFRGYLYPAAKRFCGPAGAMVFSSLVFAAAHGNVVALLPLFILAVVLCLIYEFTGSIWACMSVHFLFNAATVTIQLLVRSGIIDVPAPT